MSRTAVCIQRHLHFIHHNAFSSAQELIATVSRELQGKSLHGRPDLPRSATRRRAQAAAERPAARIPPPDSRQLLTRRRPVPLRDLPRGKAYSLVERHRTRIRAAPQAGLCYFGYADFNRALEQMQEIRRSPRTRRSSTTSRDLIEMKKTDEARPHSKRTCARPAVVQDDDEARYLATLRGRRALRSGWQVGRHRCPMFETTWCTVAVQPRGRVPQSDRELETCLRENGIPKAHYQLSFAYRQLGDEVKAKQYWTASTPAERASAARRKLSA